VLQGSDQYSVLQNVGMVASVKAVAVAKHSRNSFLGSATALLLRAGGSKPQVFASVRQEAGFALNPYAGKGA